MAGEWRTVELGEVAAVRSGYAFKSSDWTTSGIPVVKIANVKSGRLEMSGCSYVSEVNATEAGEFQLVAGDILISMTGYIGEVARVRQNNLPCVLNQRVGKFIVRDRGRLDVNYLYSFLAWSETRDTIEGFGYGSAQPNVSPSLIHKVEIPLPPLPTQRAIAHILGTLDDLIELNRETNAILEEMARALFKSWFVDFDPVRRNKDEGGRMKDETSASSSFIPHPSAFDHLFPAHFQDSELGQIPKGWEVGPILRQADLLSGGTPKTDVPSYWGGEVPWASAKDVSQCGEAFLVNTERTITRLGVAKSATKIIPALATVIVARGATTGRLTMFGHEMAMNQTCYGLRSKFDAPFSLYCRARDFSERLVQGGHGSIFDTITTSTFEATDVILPPKELLLAFDRVTGPMFDQILSNLHESRDLATLRDTLLPKLLSGDISITP